MSAFDAAMASLNSAVVSAFSEPIFLTEIGSSDPVPLFAIYSDPGISGDSFAGVNVATADLADLNVPGAVVLVRAVRYRVVNVYPDAGGMTRLVLGQSQA